MIDLVYYHFCANIFRQIGFLLVLLLLHQVGYRSHMYVEPNVLFTSCESITMNSILILSKEID